MSERLEYSGDPLPSGLPGFGGGTITVLPLPGFSRVVAAQKFGPVNDAPTVTPPNPEPPAGSNPENPTNEVVEPSAAPYPPNQARPNFCERCVPPNDEDLGNPIYYAATVQSGCEDCKGFTPGQVTGPAVASSNDGQDGIRFGNPSTLRGDGDGFYWQLSKSGMLIGKEEGTQVSIGVTGDPFLSLLNDAGDFTKFDVGPKFTGDDGNVYEPQDLEVCVDGETQTWKVLAYKPN